MSQRWHYQLFGEQFGPVSESELREMLAAGTLSPDDLVRLDKFRDWLPASKALQLETGSGPTGERAFEVIAEITELSELTFQFDDSGTTTRRTVYGRAKSPEAAFSVTGRTTAGSSHVADGERELVEPEAGPQWFYQSLGQEFGPVTLAELQSLAADGALSNTDFVREGVSGKWSRAGSVSALSAALSLARPLDASQSCRTAAAEKRFGSSLPGNASTSGRETASEGHDDRPASHSPTNNATPSVPLPVTRSGSETLPGTVRKKKKQNGTSREDAVLNEIFEEVFADDAEPVQRQASGISRTSADADRRPEASMAAVPAAHASAETPSTAPEAATRAASVVNASPSVSRPVLPAPAPSPRRSGGISIPMPDPKISAIVLLIAGISWAVWHFGLLNSLRSYSTSDLPERLAQIIAECKAMGATPSTADWNRFSQGYRSELAGTFEALMSSSASDARTKSLILATKQAMSLVAGDSNQPDYIKKNLDKLEKLVSQIPK